MPRYGIKLYTLLTNLRRVHLRGQMNVSTIGKLNLYQEYSKNYISNIIRRITDFGFKLHLPR